MMLEAARSKVAELEEDRHMSVRQLEDEEERLRNTKKSIHVKYKQLQHKSRLQEDELERLKEKLKRMTEEARHNALLDPTGHAEILENQEFLKLLISRR